MDAQGDSAQPATGAEGVHPLAAAVGTARFNLQGRRALITGGTRGIGLAIAEQLCAAGASVYLCARGADDVASAVAQLRERGFNAQVRLVAIGAPRRIP
jgi:nucleoside-diphosphate-sugar epimerase